MKRLLILIFLLSTVVAFAENIRVASLANPNVVVAFVIKDKSYAKIDFIPIFGDIASMIGLIRAGKVDAVFTNYEAAQKVRKDFGWHYSGSSISKAVYIITNRAIKQKNDLEDFKVVGSFRGGSPDILFRKLQLKKEPIFTDLNIAVQLFLKGEYDAIFLPEPHISNLILKLKELNKNYYIYDILSLYDKPYKYPINALLSKDENIHNILLDATKKAVSFINSHPEEAIKIFNANFKTYFNMQFPTNAIEEAIRSKRLQFEYFEFKE